MKITAAKVIVCCPGRNFVSLKIETDEGLYGLGDATLNGRELAVVSYLNDHLIPSLIGRDPHQIEDIWQFFYKGAYWRRGPVTMSAIAAIDTALWDIKAKAAGMPLYQLLGGKCRDGALVYGHANANDTSELLDEVARYQELGYRAIRLQVSVPGLDSTYGVSKDKLFYEPADASLPSENVWETDKYLNFIPRVFEEVRSKVGSDLKLLHDVHHRLRPIEAARLAKELEPYSLFWLEDATPAENAESFRLIRQHSTTPLAVGEVFNTIHDCRTLITEQLIDFIRTTVVHAGGISHLKKIAQFADVYQIKTGCHGATDLSPICMGASLHLNVSLPNFGIHEYMRHTPETDEVFPHAYSFKEGRLFPGDVVGHGVDIDEKLAAKFPYKRAYLPINRLEDGTMHDW